MTRRAMEPFAPLGPLVPGVHLVEASAGTGKTHQIGSLFVRLVAESGLRVEEILCVTFTRAATAELRDRLRARLMAAASALTDLRARRGVESGDEIVRALGACSADELSLRIARLVAALEDFDAAAISTIHAFCQGALRLFAFEAGVEVERPVVDVVPFLEDLVDDWIARRLHGGSVAEVEEARSASKIARDDLLGLARVLASAGAAAIRPDPPPDRATALRVEFAQFVRTELPRRLEARSVMSFDELLRTLSTRLGDGSSSSAALAAGMRRRFRAALVDEFQDTDTAQWEIFSRVFGGASHGPGAPMLFLIGDPKQAIYAFRGADVHVYRLATESADTRATMDENHRSDAAYVRAMNAVFARPDAFDLDFVQYVPVRARHGDRLAGMPALTFGWIGRRAFEEPRGEPELDKATAWVRVPELVAEEVVRILHGGATIEGRPVEPRDIAVLVRKNRQAKSVHRALRGRGVPAVLGQSGSVFQSDEARSVELFLVAMESRGREQAVRALALTPPFGCTARDVKLGTDRFVKLAARVADWVDALPKDGFARTFLRAVDEEDAIARLVSLPDGERRVTDLRHLVELVHAASLDRHLGTSGLLAWVRRQRAGDEDDPEATRVRLESDAHAVQVVTLHVSKGLQYPIVILPYLWDGAALPSPERDRLRYHDESGQLIVDVSPHRDKNDPNLAAAEREAMREALRLTYVALTRAQHAAVVFSGPFRDYKRSPLASLLHRADVRRIDDAEALRLRGDLETLAAASSGAIAVREVSAPERARFRGRLLLDKDARALRVRKYTRGRFDPFWRRVSYTNLTAGHDLPAAAEGQDWDGGEGEAAGAVAEAAGPDVPLAEFPRGAEAGKLVHAILEQLDFATLRERGGKGRPLDELITHHGRLTGVGDLAAWTLLSRELPGVLSTPLAPLGVSLSGTTAADRLDELRFDVPLAGGGRGRAPGSGLLAPMLVRPELTPAYRAALSALRITDLSGFLTGSIDLVLRAGGRYYVVDYKTNRLGALIDGTFRSCAGHYAEPAMRAEMERHHYHLQLHLYLVALHRWLATRVRDYRYETHVGGAAYLFLRGMVGPTTRPGHGVFFDAPPAATIEAMSAALEGPR